MSLVQLLEFQKIDDAARGGSLLILESLKSVPFPIERIYFLQMDEHNQHPRGFHAHHQLRQVAICLRGECRFILDDGRQKEEVWLKPSKQGLVIENKIWHEMYDFSPNTLLCVLASAYYDEADYIRDYDTFLELCTEQAS